MEKIDEESRREIFEKTSDFKNYQISVPPGHSCDGAILTGLSVRPSTLFFEELLKESGITITKPGSGNLFGFERNGNPLGYEDQKQIREFIESKAAITPDEVVEVCAKGKNTDVCLSKDISVRNVNLEDLLGKNTYRITYKEILDVLNSQKIYTSSLLPVQFYKALKVAMREEKIVRNCAKITYPI